MNKPDNLNKSVYQRFEELKIECKGNMQLIFEELGDWCYENAIWYREHPHTIKQFEWKDN